MFRKMVIFTIMALFVATSASAQFVNGGFENGDFTGWTQGAGRASAANWGGYPPNPTRFLPGGPAYDMSYNRSGVVTQGKDPRTGNQLDMVYSGNYSARVNDYTNSYHVSVISQTVNNWQADNIFFAWAAVLQASHGATDSDNFTLKLTDLTDGVDLITRSYNSYQNGPIFTETNNWFWTQWQIEQLDTTGIKGHDLNLTLLASDCPYGAHGGYVYLDGFGAAPPQPGPVPIPGSVLFLGSGLVGLIAVRKKLKK
jgi:hypothetical protein